MERVEEPSWVCEDVIEKTGLSKAFVIEAIRDVRHVVDGLLTDDFRALALPLIVRQKGDPVHRAVRDALTDRAWLVPE